MRYKNLDECLQLQHEYTDNAWVVVSERVDRDLTLLVEYKRLISGKTFDTLRTVLQQRTEETVSVHRGNETEYKGSISDLLRSKVIANNQLLKYRVKNLSVVDGVLRVEV